jgi:hypothetical protein
MHSVSEAWVSLNWGFTIKWSGWRDLNARPLRPERKNNQKVKANNFNIFLISLAFFIVANVGKC